MMIEDRDDEGRDEIGRDDALLAEWAAELADRIRDGEPFDPRVLARDHPERAGALRHLLPAIALMAELAATSRCAAAGSFAAPAGPPPADELPAGLAERPDCQIRRVLGRGGMGVVYLAHNTLMGRDEAIKVVSRRLVDRPGLLDRFLREIRAVARLRHPNIVTAYHAARLGEDLELVMEYVDGHDLAKLVAARGPMPATFACEFARQAALGIQHAHEAGLVHRDIKPGNLMLARDGDRATVKILDFGLAKAAREEKVDGSLTVEGQALGTPHYIAPEQILDASGADIRADIYSLGCTLYFLLTGRTPFRADTLYDLYQAHISREVAPLDGLRPDVPAGLTSLVAKMMAKDPAHRFRTPAEVARALEPFVERGGLVFKDPRAGALGGDPRPTGEAETVAVSAAPASATGAGGPAIVPGGMAEAGASGARWEDLIEWRGTDGAPAMAPAPAHRRRPPGMWAAVGIGLLTFGLLAAWLGGVFRLRTPDGMIVLEGVPEDAEVLVDGHEITLTRPGDGEPVLVRAVPGQRRVEVKADGFRAFGEVVTVEAGGEREIRVRLEPLHAARPAEGPVPSAATPGWTPLFNGKDLTGWAVDSGVREAWRVEDGDLVVTGSGDWKKGGFLLSDRDFSDFRLRFEYQPGPGSNSGVTFRALPGEFEGRLAHPLQVELFDVDRNILNGSFIWTTSIRTPDFVPPTWPVRMGPAGSWNTVELEVQGDSLRVWFNAGEALVADLGKLAVRPIANPALGRRSGRIGFQSHTGVVRFRNIEILELPPRQLPPRDAGAYAEFAAKLRRMGRLDEAVAAAGEAIRLRPDLAAAHRDLGGALLGKRDWDGAIAAFREAIRLRPDDPESHHELGLALDARGRHEEALAEFGAAVRLRSKDAPRP